MASNRVAEPGGRTDQVLALHSAPVHPTYRSGADGEAALDHRARLRRAEARTRTGSLRGTRLARFSPSRYPLHRGLWVPGSRTEPFFPPSPKCRPNSALGARPARVARHNPWSIATLRQTIARVLVRQLSGCPFCGTPFL